MVWFAEPLSGASQQYFTRTCVVPGGTMNGSMT
jgi:hypothetical protein